MFGAKLLRRPNIYIKNFFKKLKSKNNSRWPPSGDCKYFGLVELYLLTPTSGDHHEAGGQFL